MSPFVSIVIPMFNASKTIRETIAALNNQTLKDFELVIVDDGSTDNSDLIVKQTKADFPITLISQPNHGPAAARNTGARSASAEIIIFIDSDCVPLPDFIEKITAPFENPDVFGVQGEYETKNKNSFMARYVGYEIYFRHEKMKNMDSIDHMATYACAYRKKAFAGFINNFKKANMEDTELSYRLSKEKKKLVFAPKARVRHPHPETFSKFMKQQYQRGYWRALGHIIHPDKLIKDSYMGSSMAVQGSLVLLFAASILFYIGSLFFGNPLAFSSVPLLSLALIYISNINFGIYCLRFEKKMLPMAPFIASIRSAAGTLGFLVGMVNFGVFRIGLNKPGGFQLS